MGKGSTQARRQAVKLTLALLVLAQAVATAVVPLRLGNRLELFTDHHLIERLEGGASLRLHTPERAGVALRFDRPWEGLFSAYVTVIHDRNRSP